jgi:hypothetical protein
MAALPAALAGEWQSALVQAIVVVDGKPKAMPLSDKLTAEQVAVAAGGISIRDATMRQAFVLEAISGNAEFALPGESPLGAEEFLGPVLTEAGVRCAAVDLPQFQGAAPAGLGMATTFRIFAVSDRQMLMVMLVAEAAEPGLNGMRAVLRYSR